MNVYKQGVPEIFKRKNDFHHNILNDVKHKDCIE